MSHHHLLSGEEAIRAADGAQREQGVGHLISRASRARRYQAVVERLEQVEQLQP